MVKSEIILLQQVVCSLLLVVGTGLLNAHMNKISKVIKSKAVHVHSRWKSHISHVVLLLRYW
jgi:hypothetical protein